MREHHIDIIPINFPSFNVIIKSNLNHWLTARRGMVKPRCFPKRGKKPTKIADALAAPVTPPPVPPFSPSSSLPSLATLSSSSQPCARNSSLPSFVPVQLPSRV